MRKRREPCLKIFPLKKNEEARWIKCCTVISCPRGLPCPHGITCCVPQKMVSLMLRQEDWILGPIIFCIFMDLDCVSVHKLATDKLGLLSWKWQNGMHIFNANSKFTAGGKTHFGSFVLLAHASRVIHIRLSISNEQMLFKWPKIRENFAFLLSTILK